MPNVSNGKNRLSPETLKAYRTILSKQIEDLKGAASASDIARVLQICHKIRGSSALFGNNALGIACREVELAEAIHDNEYLMEKIQHVYAAAEVPTSGR